MVIARTLRHKDIKRQSQSHPACEAQGGLSLWSRAPPFAFCVTASCQVFLFWFRVYRKQAGGGSVDSAGGVGSEER